MGILSEYRELGEIERAISWSPNSGLTECTYGCGLNLEHCSKSQQVDTGYVYIYKKAGSASGLPPFIGGNLLACSVAITQLSKNPIPVIQDSESEESSSKEEILSSEELDSD